MYLKGTKLGAVGQGTHIRGPGEGSLQPDSVLIPRCPHTERCVMEGCLGN